MLEDINHISGFAVLRILSEIVHAFQFQQAYSSATVLKITPPVLSSALSSQFETALFQRSETDIPATPISLKERTIGFTCFKVLGSVVPQKSLEVVYLSCVIKNMAPVMKIITLEEYHMIRLGRIGKPNRCSHTFSH